MTLVRWTPRTPTRWANDDSSLMNRWSMFDELFGLSPATSCDWMPALDVRENESAYSVKVDLPGMNREQVEISFEGDVLTISGERKEESEKADGQVHRTERFVGKFTRSLRFPGDVQPEKIEAAFQDGVLEVTLPKAEAARKRRIEVK
ncbi:MAG: Hsp20/alpha crystallin family protein [Candidatus Eisenbacteria bacterium]|nr:Hsp20/alpha crystallin family protein [Candidatus Eisenbacteria bacterium]